jgi:hypothetical protein
MRNVLTQSLIHGRNSNQLGPENIILSISPYDPTYSNSWLGSNWRKSIAAAAAAAAAFEDGLLQLWFVITPQNHCRGLKSQLGSSSNESTHHQALDHGCSTELTNYTLFLPTCCLPARSILLL